MDDDQKNNQPDEVSSGDQTQDNSVNTPDEQSDANNKSPDPIYLNSAEYKKSKLSFGKKKLIIIAVIAVVLIGGGVGAYLLTKKEEPKNNQTSSSTANKKDQTQDNNEAKDTIKEIMTDTVAYAFSPKTADAYNLFWRMASVEGEKNDVKLSYSNVSYSDVLGQKIAVSVSEGQGEEYKELIVYSEDSGKTYKKIYEGKSLTSGNGFGDQITSLKISSDGLSLVAGILPSGSVGKVVEITLSNLEQKTLFTAKQGAIFVHAYDPASGKLVYNEGCYNCDANLGNELFVVDTKTGESKSLAKSTATNIVEPVGANKNFTEFMIINITKDDSMQPAESFYSFYLGPPYSLSTIKLDDMSEKKVANFGEKLKPDAEGKLPQVFYTSGFAGDGFTPYYAYDKKVFMVDGNGSPFNVFESEKALLSVDYVNLNEVVAGTGDYLDFKLINYNTKTKKLVNILNGDQNTRIIGVTSK